VPRLKESQSAHVIEEEHGVGKPDTNYYFHDRSLRTNGKIIGGERHVCSGCLEKGDLRSKTKKKAHPSLEALSQGKPNLNPGWKPPVVIGVEGRYKQKKKKKTKTLVGILPTKSMGGGGDCHAKVTSRGYKG